VGWKELRSDALCEEERQVKENKKVVVVGLGEVGKPLFQLLSEHHDVVGVDVSPPAARVKGPEILHICFPFEIKDFIGETARYISLFEPALTIINSTVGVGTTRAVAQRTGTSVVHSPVRGKHVRMLDELRSYQKFIGAMEPEAGEQAAKHFKSLGMKTKVLTTPEATELAKLTETTYFGLMIAWAQELERYCDQSGADYEEIISFYEEIKFFPPVKYFPGIIGGHCVMPNIEILSKFDDSAMLEAIRASNRKKTERDAHKNPTVSGAKPLQGSRLSARELQRQD
jgi:UDP-N-acetyl-D-mannosaminuronate dehydrogenase